MLITRRMGASKAGRQVDLRRTLRGALRQGGEITQLAMKAPRPRWPNLVVLCDISGSMSQYSRLVLHFVHAVANRQGQGWARVHGFTLYVVGEGIEKKVDDFAAEVAAQVAAAKGA